MHIINFRSFQETRLENIKNINTFVGANKSGKSNLISVLKVLNSLSRNDFQQKEFSETVFDHNNEKQIEIEIDFVLNESERSQLIIDS